MATYDLHLTGLSIGTLTEVLQLVEKHRDEHAGGYVDERLNKPMVPEWIDTTPQSVQMAPVAVSAKEPEDSKPTVQEAPEAEKEPEITGPALREVLVFLRQQKGREAVSEILARHGAKAFPDLDPKEYSAVLKEANDAAR